MITVGGYMIRNADTAHEWLRSVGIEDIDIPELGDYLYAIVTRSPIETAEKWRSEYESLERDYDVLESEKEETDGENDALQDEIDDMRSTIERMKRRIGKRIGEEPGRMCRGCLEGIKAELEES